MFFGGSGLERVWDVLAAKGLGLQGLGLGVSGCLRLSTIKSGQRDQG